MEDASAMELDTSRLRELNPDHLHQLSASSNPPRLTRLRAAQRRLAFARSELGNPAGSAMGMLSPDLVELVGAFVVTRVPEWAEIEIQNCVTILCGTCPDGRARDFSPALKSLGVPAAAEDIEAKFHYILDAADEGTLLQTLLKLLEDSHYYVEDLRIFAKKLYVRTPAVTKRLDGAMAEAQRIVRAHFSRASVDR
eukprot:COSAG04_NODE_279_length_18210_cov_5.657225_5_plen_196_part_00